MIPTAATSAPIRARTTHASRTVAERVSVVPVNPPELRTNLLPRPRLVRALLGRWQHRVTVVSGGAGLGKTTLLGQAIVELLVGRGDTDDAERIARQALAVDPWAEDAHGVLIAAALAGDDRSTAGRQLSRCLAAMEELGVEPSAVTLQLARRLRRRPG
jgi:hypothetical protein